jgi:hypothetical protein
VHLGYRYLSSLLMTAALAAPVAMMAVAESCGIRQPRSKTMIYTMTKPCPICNQQLTKQKPTETVPCICGQHV